MVRWIKVFVASGLVLLAIGVLAACVWYANDWVVSSLATATVLAWLAGWLVVVYRRERVRAAAIGAVIAGGIYWMLVLGPWFNVNIGPTLLTSRLLAWISAPSVPAGQQLAIYTSYTPVNYTTGFPIQSGDYLIGGSGTITASPQVVWSYPTAVQQSPAIVSVPARQIAGQWAFTWLFAMTGGGLAWLFARRTNSVASKESKSESDAAEGKA